MEICEEIIRKAIEFAEAKIQRKLLFVYLQGSQNYGLQTSSSDYDLKAFCIPSFDDFYTRSLISLTIDYEHGQITIHDARMLPELLYKMNPVYLESFFSKCLFVRKPNGQFAKVTSPLDSLLFNDLFITNYDVLIRASISYFRKKVDEIHKPSAIRIPVVKEYGYDIKSASHAFRIYYLIHGLEEAGGANIQSPFTVYQSLLTFKGMEEERNLVLRIKTGSLEESEIARDLSSFTDYLNKRFQIHQEKSKNPPPSLESLKERIYRLIKDYFAD